MEHRAISNARKKHDEGENPDANEHQSDERTLAATEAAHDLCAATGADARALGNPSLAMRANQGLHKPTISQAR